MAFAAFIEDRSTYPRELLIACRLAGVIGLTWPEAVDMEALIRGTAPSLADIEKANRKKDDINGPYRPFIVGHDWRIFHYPEKVPVAWEISADGTSFNVEITDDDRDALIFKVLLNDSLQIAQVDLRTIRPFGTNTLGLAIDIIQPFQSEAWVNPFGGFTTLAQRYDALSLSIKILKNALASAWAPYTKTP